MQTAHIHGLLIELVVGEGGGNADLDLLGRALAHHHVVHLFEVDADGVADLIAGNANGFTQHRSTEAQHRHLSGATTDVDNHRPNGLSDRKARTDGRCHRFINQVNLARPSHAGFADGATLHTGDATGDAHHQTRGHDAAALIAFGDEGFEHLLSGIKIGNHPIAQRADGPDVPRGAAKHQLGFITHRHGGATLEIKSHHGGLLQHDAPA